MQISAAFDAGNIEVINADNPADIRLAIRKDHMSDFYQWFYFRISGVRDTELNITIMNASGAAYTDGWQGYRTAASYDRENWFRLETSYREGKLRFSAAPTEDTLYFAYFAPYSMERHHDLIADASADERVRHEVLGQTIDGQDMDLLTIGERSAERKNIWLCARQHPGETMAEWWMEGALEMLLDGDDPVARKLLEKACFFIVPNMNPDGSRRGHLRTNAAGVNLNRVWLDPSPQSSPEVYLVRQKMHEVGVDFHLDVHGDEGLPYNFIAGFEGIPSITDKQLGLLDTYQTHLMAISPDFQREFGYEKDAPGTADMKKCTDYIAENFGCLAMTLEMPFKDNAKLPDQDQGWSPARCKHLARSCLTALLMTFDEI